MRHEVIASLFAPRWLADAKQCQRDGCSLAHEIRAADADRYESCISRKLFSG